MAREILEAALSHIARLDPAIRVKTEKGVKGRFLYPESLEYCIQRDKCGKNREYLVIEDYR